MARRVKSLSLKKKVVLSISSLIILIGVFLFIGWSNLVKLLKLIRCMKPVQ